MDTHFLIRHQSAKSVAEKLTINQRQEHPKMKITTIGIDLAKDIFRVKDLQGQPVSKFYFAGL